MWTTPFYGCLCLYCQYIDYRALVQDVLPQQLQEMPQPRAIHAKCVSAAHQGLSRNLGYELLLERLESWVAQVGMPNLGGWLPPQPSLDAWLGHAQMN